MSIFLAVVTLLLTVLPALWLFQWIYHQDLHPEPRADLWITFLLGMLTVLPITGIELLANVATPYVNGLFPNALWTAFGVAALPEEALKFLVLALFCTRRRAFDEPMDGVVYGVVVALGFALAENLAHVYMEPIVDLLAGRKPDLIDIGTPATRAVTAVPGHMGDGALMGAFVAAAYVRPARRVALIAAGLALAVLSHGLYDFGLMLSEAALVQREPLSNVEAIAAMACGVIPALVLAAQGVGVHALVTRMRHGQHTRAIPIAVHAPLFGELQGTVEMGFGFFRARIDGWFAYVTGALTFVGALMVTTALVAMVVAARVDPTRPSPVGVWIEDYNADNPRDRIEEGTLRRELPALFLPATDVARAFGVFAGVHGVSSLAMAAVVASAWERMRRRG